MMNKGYFGEYGGQFVPELLMPPLIELEEAMDSYLENPSFKKDLKILQQDFVGRPTPLRYCARLSENLGFPLWLKREDLAHTGAHKINNTVGQALLAQYMGKKTLLAETGAGQHGVATATAAAMLGMKCLVYMGAKDIVRQAHNVRRMELWGARVEPVKTGTQTLKDAINGALRDWIAHQEECHYCMGSVVGPHPFPLLVRKLQSVIGREIKEQIYSQAGANPHTLIACVGGGSNAAGMFSPYEQDTAVRLIGVEAAGRGGKNDYHSATLNKGTPGILHGTYSFLLQTDKGQILPSHSVAPGLDYPGVGPEHAFFRACKRAEYTSVTDQAAMDAFYRLTRTEGIIPALESSHAVAYALSLKGSRGEKEHVVVNLSGRGDKDLGIVFDENN